MEREREREREGGGRRSGYTHRRYTSFMGVIYKHHFRNRQIKTLEVARARAMSSLEHLTATSRCREQTILHHQGGQRTSYSPGSPTHKLPVKTTRPGFTHSGTCTQNPPDELRDAADKLCVCHHQVCYQLADALIKQAATRSSWDSAHERLCKVLV